MIQMSYVKHAPLKARVVFKERLKEGADAIRKPKRTMVTAISVEDLLFKLEVLGKHVEITSAEYFYRYDSCYGEQGKLSILADSKVVFRRPKVSQVGNFSIPSVVYNKKRYLLNEVDGSEYLHRDSSGMTGHRRLYTLGREV